MVPEGRKVVRRRARLLGSLLSVLGGLLCVELALRALGLPEPRRTTPRLWGGEDGNDQQFAPDAVTFYRLRAGHIGWQANALGMRGYLPPRQKREGELRICALGESVVSGHSVTFDDAFGVVLANLLQTRAKGGLV